MEYRNNAGKLHREDGPAIELANGTRSWWINGELHREDGPAVELANGTGDWWINGERIPDSEVDYYRVRTWVTQLEQKG
jgi:hypothetical protein